MTSRAAAWPSQVLTSTRSEMLLVCFKIFLRFNFRFSDGALPFLKYLMIG